MIWLTKFVVRSLNLAAVRFRSRRPKHLLTGKQGEIEAYLHLRALGYRIVATNFRVPYNRGEIDLIGWDDGVLCFIEVKTRTSADFAPPSTAVDPDKRKHIRSVARQYLRRLPVDRPPPCRFDIVSIVLGDAGGKPMISVHKGAFNWDTGKPRKSWRRNLRDRHFWRRTR
jgi:putative endonuclease